MTKSDLRRPDRWVLRGRSRDVGVAALVCGILALLLLSSIYGPVSRGSVLIGTLDIAVLAVVRTLTSGDTHTDNRA